MKKSIALIITFVVILTYFAACKKEEGKFEGGVLATNAKGQVVAAVVTEENGKLQRGDGGNAVVLVTDAKGNNVKDKEGEIVTRVEHIDNAIVIGNRIEMADFAINIPDGWTDNYSLDMLNIIKSGTNDSVSISAMRDEKLADVEADNNKMMELYPGGAKVNKAMTVAGEEANFVSAYTTVNGTGVYLGFITFSHQGVIYRCMLNSDRDLSGEIDSIVAILNTIEFVN